MRHYEFAEWLDYARGLGSVEQRASMEQHLLTACESCASTLAAVRAFARVVTADEAFEPPPNVVRCARAIFAQTALAQLPGLPRLLVRLVQDSWRQPLPAGVRSHARSARQALYQAGRLFVDVRLERRPGNREIVLVGQLLCPDDHAASAHRPVVLTSDGVVLTTTQCNAFGEFQVEYVPAGQIRLHIGVENDTRRIEIGLNRLTPGGTRDAKA